MADTWCGDTVGHGPHTHDSDPALWCPGRLAGNKPICVRNPTQPVCTQCPAALAERPLDLGPPITPADLEETIALVWEAHRQRVEAHNDATWAQFFHGDGLAGLAARDQAATHPIADSLAEVGHGLCGKPEPADPSGACWYEKLCPIHGTTTPAEPAQERPADPGEGADTSSTAQDGWDRRTIEAWLSLFDAASPGITHQVRALLAERDRLAATLEQKPVGLIRFNHELTPEQAAGFRDEFERKMRDARLLGRWEYEVLVPRPPWWRRFAAKLDRISKEGP